jgi:hypothetical protein
MSNFHWRATILSQRVHFVPDCATSGRSGKDLRKESIFEIIQAAVFKALDGRFYSVLSAIQQQRFDLETLPKIADISYKLCQERKTLTALDSVVTNFPIVAG